MNSFSWDMVMQIENEYNSIQLAYRDAGTHYVQWAANMALGTNTGVPWIMCKQRDAPDPAVRFLNEENTENSFPDVFLECHLD